MRGSLRLSERASSTQGTYAKVGQIAAGKRQSMFASSRKAVGPGYCSNTLLLPAVFSLLERPGAIERVAAVPAHISLSQHVNNSPGSHR